MRALCFGDLHLGAGADLGARPGERLEEQMEVLERLVEVANELEVDVVLFAGDAWERRRPVAAEIRAFQAAIAELRSDLVVCLGNHDVEAIGGITGYDVALHGRAQTRLSRAPAVIPAYSWAGQDVAIAVLPWTPVATLVAAEGGGDRDEINRRAAEHLLDVARGLRAQIDGSAILLAHWSVGGAQTDSGAPVELFREPVLDAVELAAMRWDAIVLGHIHKPQMIELLLPTAPMFYVGSPMPLNFGEATGKPRGAVLLDVEPGRTTAVRVPVKSRPLVTLDAKMDEVSTFLSLVDGERARRQDLDGAIVKVRIRATPEQARRFHAATLRRDLELAGAHRVWAIQVDVDRGEIVRGPRVDEQVDDVEAMRLWLKSAGATPGANASIEDRTPALLETHTTYLEEMTR